MNSSLPAIFSSLSRSFSKETGIVNIQDAADFKEKVLNNEHPVVVDFHATWLVFLKNDVTLKLGVVHAKC